MASLPVNTESHFLGLWRKQNIFGGSVIWGLGGKTSINISVFHFHGARVHGLTSCCGVGLWVFFNHHNSCIVTCRDPDRLLWSHRQTLILKEYNNTLFPVGLFLEPLDFFHLAECVREPTDGLTTAAWTSSPVRAFLRSCFCQRLCSSVKPPEFSGRSSRGRLCVTSGEPQTAAARPWSSQSVVKSVLLV